MQLRIRATGQVMYGEEFNRTICSLPITPELLDQHGADPVLEGPQPLAERYQFVFQDGVEQIDGQWFTKYSVANLDAEAIAAVDANQAEFIRNERDKKLTECDWRVIKALESNQPQDFQWASYRQALRDIPLQTDFPWVVSWPNKP